MINDSIKFADMKNMPVITDETRKLCNDYEICVAFAN